MQIALRNKTAIVTGASRGIGREIALTLGRLGAGVAVNFGRNEHQAQEVVSEIIRLGGAAIPVQADVRKREQIDSLFDRTLERFGTIDILVNNAGIAVFKAIQDVTEEEFDNIFACNVKGLFFACQQAAKKMADGGRIINISSSVTKVMMPTYGAYGATKGAVEQITKVLAKELGHRNITVNTLSPGPVDTELFRQGKSEQQIQQLANMSAFGRIGTPMEIADAVALLVSEQAGWISGQNICVNGGFVA